MSSPLWRHYNRDAKNGISDPLLIFLIALPMLCLLLSMAMDAGKLTSEATESAKMSSMLP